MTPEITQKIREYASKQIADIEADERFHYKDADAWTNAPLALIQTHMKARHGAFTETLDLCDQALGDAD